MNSTQKVFVLQSECDIEPREILPASQAACALAARSGVDTSRQATHTSVPTMRISDWIASAHTTAAKPPIIE